MTTTIKGKSEKQVAYAEALLSGLVDVDPARHYIATKIAEISDASAVIDYIKDNAIIEYHADAQAIADWVTSLSGNGFEARYKTAEWLRASLRRLWETINIKIRSASEIDSLRAGAESGKHAAWRAEAAQAFLSRIGYYDIAR